MNKVKLIVLVFGILLLCNCTTPLTSMGAQVESVAHQHDKTNCEYIDIVTVEMDFQTMEGAVNKARNIAAEKGGNSVNIIDIDSSGEFQSTVVFEVLNCK